MPTILGFQMDLPPAIRPIDRERGLSIANA
jgi:hypothetical protein